MKRKVTYLDQTMTVDVEQKGSMITVTLGEETFCFERLSQGVFISDHHVFRTRPLRKNANQHVIQVNDHALVLGYEDPYLLKGSNTRAGGKGDVIAVMPGRVVKLMVKPGDLVQKDQPVLVLEAMKMENEIKAPAPGTVAQIFVAEGDSVGSHARMVQIDPQEEA